MKHPLLAEALRVFWSLKMKFKKFNTINKQEIDEVKKILETGTLSGFVAEWGHSFLGGERVKKLEEFASAQFSSRYCISYNSWTSGLISAIGAIGISPGDQVITTPWTMSASASAILHFNGVPVFADIDERTFCIDTNSVESLVNEHTKAIMSVDIFGQSANTENLMRIANKYSLKVISDSAQAPGAMRNGRPAGTLTHFGGISLNYHKHIHCGEGGLLFTEDENLALRARLLRNHAEVSIVGSDHENFNNMVGFNFRLGEIEAAITAIQLTKLSSIIDKRRQLANILDQEFADIAGLITPYVDSGNTHVYYVYALRITDKKIRRIKDVLVERLRREGMDFLDPKYENLHLLPVFQKKIAFGLNGFPWNLNDAGRNLSYKKGICPVAERMQDEEYLGIYLNAYDFEEDDIKIFCQTFKKIWHDLQDSY